MATRIENIFRMRDLLRRPYPNAPSFHDLFRQEISEEQDIVNATNNSGNPWATAEYQLNYNSNQSEYAINVSDFGKVLFVVKETGNPYIPFIPVNFDSVSQQHYGTVLGWFNNAYAQSWSLTEAPERMSFWRSGVLNAQFMVSINPMSQQSATYHITYLPGYIGDSDPLESSIQLPEHAELVRLRGAMAQLVNAEWFEDEAQNRDRRKELMASYAYQLERKEGLFAAYLGSMNIPGIVDIESWNEGSY